MSDKLRVIRDSLETGDDVLVVHHGRTPRRARVINVMRSALRVRYEDSGNTLHTVLMKDVRRVEEAEVLTKAPVPAQRASRTQLKAAAAAVTEAHYVDAAAAIVAVPVPTPQASAGELGDMPDLDVWMDMGKEVRARIDERLECNSLQLQALRDDQVAIAAEIDRLTRVNAVLLARRERVETVLSW